MFSIKFQQIKPKSLFGNINSEAPSNLFGKSTPITTKQPAFETTLSLSGEQSNGATGFGGFVNMQKHPESSIMSKPISTAAPQPNFSFSKPVESKPPAQSFQQPKVAIESNPKPLITVPPTYTAVQNLVTKGIETLIPLKSEEVSEEIKIVHAMINEELENFQKDLKDIILRSKSINLNVDLKGEAVSSKKVNELQKFYIEAAETNDSISAEIHSLRLSLSDAFSMASEARTKITLYNTQNHLQHQDIRSMSQTSKKQLARLEIMLSANERQLQMVLQQLDAQWCFYLDAQKTHKKDIMRVPGLENIYQTLSKQRDIIQKYRTKLNMLKNKLGLRDTVKALEGQKHEITVDSLTDSIISMSIVDQVQAENGRLSSNKLNLLKNCLKERKTVAVKPNRPNRPGLNSEIVRERRENIKMLFEKLKADRSRVPATIFKKTEKSVQINTPQVSKLTTKTTCLSKPSISDPTKSSQSNLIPNNLTSNNPAMISPVFDFKSSIGLTPTDNNSGMEQPSFSFSPLAPQVPGRLLINPVAARTQNIFDSMPPLSSPNSTFKHTTNVSFGALEQSKSSNFTASAMSKNELNTDLGAPKVNSNASTSKSVLFGTTTITPVVSSIGNDKSNNSNIQNKLATTISFTQSVIDKSDDHRRSALSTSFSNIVDSSKVTSKETNEPETASRSAESPLGSLINMLQKDSGTADISVTSEASNNKSQISSTTVDTKGFSFGQQSSNSSFSFGGALPFMDKKPVTFGITAMEKSATELPKFSTTSSFNFGADSLPLFSSTSPVSNANETRPLQLTSCVAETKPIATDKTLSIPLSISSSEEVKPTVASFSSKSDELYTNKNNTTVNKEPIVSSEPTKLR